MSWAHDDVTPALNGTSSSTTTSTAASTSSTSSASTTSSARAQLDALASHGKQSVQALGNRPTVMKCSGCATELAIPPSTWQWTCSNGHVNTYGQTACTQCQTGRGPSMSWPAMLCSRCGTMTGVPGSEAESALKGTFASLRSALHGFIDPPRLFHCEHCNTSLVVPQGSWTCQACTRLNTEGSRQCAQCSQTKAAQRVLCGHCHRATAVPDSGMEDIIKSGLASVQRWMGKGSLDLQGKPNVQCPACAHAVALPAHVPAAASTVPAAAVVPPASASAGSNVAPVSTSALPPPSATPASEFSLPLTCEHCHHQFTLTRGNAASAASAVPAAGAASQYADAAAQPAAGSSAAAAGGRGVDMQVALVAPPELQQGGAAAATSSTSATSTAAAI